MHDHSLGGGRKVEGRRLLAAPPQYPRCTSLFVPDDLPSGETHVRPQGPAVELLSIRTHPTEVNVYACT